MNEWSRTRRRNALLIVLCVVAIIAALPFYFFTKVVPTCFDNKINGDETGVDCGGSCSTLCATQSLPLVLKGDARVLRVATSSYEVVAYISNPNPSGEVLKAGYSFTLYDATSSVPVKTISGVTFIPKGTDFAIFEGPFDTGDKMPTRAVFDWDDSTLTWEKNTDLVPSVDAVTTGVTDASSTPRIDARVSTDSITPLTNVSIVALVFDQTGTIRAASRTYLDSLTRGETLPAVFSWPEPFNFAPVSVKLLTIVLPDSSYVR